MGTTSLEELRKVHRAEPFRPFTIHVVDGSQISVPHRENLCFSPSGRSVAVSCPLGSLRVIEIADVSEIEVQADGMESARMTIERVRELYNAQPFQPFVIHLADGREVAVHHRDFIMAVPSGRTLYVCQPDDTVNIIDILLVTDNEIKRTTAMPVTRSA